MEAINVDQVLRLQRERLEKLRHVARCQQVDGLNEVTTCSIDGLVLPCGASSVSAVR